MSDHEPFPAGLSKVTSTSDAGAAWDPLTAVLGGLERRAEDLARRDAMREELGRLIRDYRAAAHPLYRAIERLSREDFKRRGPGLDRCSIDRPLWVKQISIAGRALRRHPGWIDQLTGKECPQHQLLRVAAAGVRDTVIDATLADADARGQLDQLGWQHVVNDLGRDLLAVQRRIYEQAARHLGDAFDLWADCNPQHGSATRDPPPSHAGDSDLLDDISRDVLTVLRERYPRRLTYDQIASAANCSKRSVADRVPRLLVAGLVERPAGPKSGTRITSQGRAAIA